MTLGEVFAASFAERTDVTVGLAFDGHETHAPGYARQPASWRVRGTDATAVVEFGPLEGRAVVNEGLLFVDGRRVKRMPMAAKLDLVPGMRFEYEVTVSARA